MPRSNDSSIPTQRSENDRLGTMTATDEVGRHALRGSSRVPTSASLIFALAGLSAIAVVLAGAEPTGHALGDVFWSAVFGASLSMSLSDARRWTWFGPAFVGLAVASNVIGVVAGLGAAGLVIFFSFSENRRRRWMGALVGLLAAQALVRGRSYGFTGLPTLVVAATCIPAYWSAYLNTSNRVRRLAKAALAVGVVAVTLLTIFTAVSAARARNRVLTAIDFSQQAVDAVDQNDPELATSLLIAAHNELRSIERDFGQLWLAPGRLVPILGQHSTALQVMADSGADVARAGAGVVFALDFDAILAADGSVDVALTEDLVRRTNFLLATLLESTESINDIDMTWIARPAASRIDDVRAELARLDDPIGDVQAVTSILPAMLGSEEERRYLVMFMTPAELRAGGGLAGNWAELSALDGRLQVIDAGRGNDLNAAIDGAADLPGPQISQDYARWRVDELFQNLPAVPDFRWVAAAGAAFYEQATGTAIDAVIGVDSSAMGGLAELVGGVEVDGRNLGPAELEEFILTGQYVDFDDDEDRRVEVLDALTRTMFEEFTSSRIPSPFRLADVIGPLVSAENLRIVSFDSREAAAVEALEANGRFPEPGPHDLLAIRTQNLGENKIDTYLQRDVTYQLLYDPETGEAQASVTVVLTNSAPDSGLPDAIIGNNDQGFDFGTNATQLQLYSPLGFRNVSVDGEPAGVELGHEFGWPQVGVRLEIPAGRSQTVRFDLAGGLDLADGYRLLIDTQPMVRPDTVTLDIRQVGVGSIDGIVGWEDGSAAKVTVESDQWVAIPQAE